MLAGAAVALVLSAAGFSQAPTSLPPQPGSGAADSACAADSARLCQGPGGPNGYADCLRQRYSELSSGCRSEHPTWAPPPASAPKSRGPGTMGAGGGGPGGCAGDAARLCSPEDNKPGRRADCLRRHVNELSQDCRESHPEWKPSPEAAWTPAPDVHAPWKIVKAKWKAACADSLGKVCKRAWSDEARLWSCVTRHWNDLSQACAAFARSDGAWARQCPSETQRFCLRAQPSEQTACMLPHEADFTPECEKFAVSLKKADAAK